MTHFTVSNEWLMVKRERNESLNEAENLLVSILVTRINKVFKIDKC